jgi:hypothetical protein
VFITVCDFRFRTLGFRHTHSKIISGNSNLFGLPTAVGCKRQLAGQATYNLKTILLTFKIKKIMKLKKMSLKEISGVLSREEMKKIMAGSGWTNVYCGFSQVSDYFCKQYDSC